MTFVSSSSPPTEILAAIREKWPEPLVNWRRLAGGRTNATWLGRSASGDVVVKLYGGAMRNPLFPNDPEVEVKALEYLAPFGFVPESACAIPSTRWSVVIYRHLPGEMWRRDALAVGRLLRNLHGIKPPSGLRECADGSAALLEQAAMILSLCKEPEYLNGLRPDIDVPPSGKSVFLHGDVVPGNLIAGEKNMFLIDWQCPGIGDPCEDIAMFLSPAMQRVYRGAALNDAEFGVFFDGYDDALIKARYQALAPAYHWRMAAYCLWQSENGQRDYASAMLEELDALEKAN